MINTIDTIADWVEDVNVLDMKQPTEWEIVDSELFTAQYSYIKLGLLLTKIRNTSAWKYCGTKLESFKAWCQSKINLNVWQANQYIDAAEIALYLIGTGTSVLPKNLSQCLALRKAYQAEESYYGERPQLDAAWAQVTNHYQPHQITAGKIHAIVDPDWADNQPSKIDRTIVDRAVELAKKRGVDLNEYLGDLLDEDAALYDEWATNQDDPEDDPQLNAEMQAIVDRVEYQWLKPKSVLEMGDLVIDRMDEFFNSMLRPRAA
jgi:hypothetical protein